MQRASWFIGCALAALTLGLSPAYSKPVDTSADRDELSTEAEATSGPTWVWIGQRATNDARVELRKAAQKAPAQTPAALGGFPAIQEAADAFVARKLADHSEVLQSLSPVAHDLSAMFAPDYEEALEAGRCWLDRCNDRDDDRDGRIDEDAHGKGAACFRGRGACRAEGELVCGRRGFLRCDAEPGDPSDEVCDGIDNDCDGHVDEHIPVVPTSCGVGACGATGELRCKHGALEDTCEAGEPADEVCDGEDNDCDGVVDDDIPMVDTTCGVGACGSTGKWMCRGGEMVDTCEAGEPDAEECNGADDDCDGANDEGLEVQEVACGVGVCGAEGLLGCQDGEWLDTCEPGEPGAEVCNGRDDDCDGEADEGGEVYRLTNWTGGQYGLMAWDFNGAGIYRWNMDDVTFTIRPNGTATIDGTVSVAIIEEGPGDLGEEWTLHMELVYRGQGDAFGGPKIEDEEFQTPEITDLWRYWDMTEGTMVRPGSMVTMEQRPRTGNFPFQFGISANGKDHDLGSAVWFYYTRFDENGRIIHSRGDLLTGAELIDEGCVPGDEICDDEDNDLDGNVDEGSRIYALDEYAPNGHAIWLPGFTGGGTTKMHFDDDARLTLNNDGTGTITGTASVHSGPAPAGEQWTVSVNLQRRGLGPDFGGPKIERAAIQPPSVSDWWEYYDVTDGTISRDGSNVTLTQRPANGRYPMQLGLAANNKNAHFGLSFWFDWVRTDEDGTVRNGHGDFNLNAEFIGDEECYEADEICDGIDNDLDGAIDEGFGVGEACEVGTGACAAPGVVECTGTGGAACVGEPGEPGAETCDGTDEDCDGAVDEEIDPVPTHCGVGACGADGEITCQGGELVDSCTPGEPVDEVCSEVDDDCDGVVDEGQRIYSVQEYAPNGHAIWLRGFTGDGTTIMHFEDDARMVWNNDGSASLTATAVVVRGPAPHGELWDVNLTLNYRGQGAEFGGPKLERRRDQPPEVTDLWDYFDLVDGTLTRPGSVVTMTMRPADGRYPLQLGFVANGKNLEYGLSVWFDWVRTDDDGTVRNWHGDFNLNAELISEDGCF